MKKRWTISDLSTDGMIQISQRRYNCTYLVALLELIINIELKFKIFIFGLAVIIFIVYDF